MSAITTHVLDTSVGRPAEGIVVTLALRTDDGRWTKLAEGRTDADGRISNLLPQRKVQQADVYRLRFAVGEYFAGLGTSSFYPYVDVVFTVRPGQRYHVPLLLNPFGYSTYRGS